METALLEGIVIANDPLEVRWHTAPDPPLVVPGPNWRVASALATLPGASLLRLRSIHVADNEICFLTGDLVSVRVNADYHRQGLNDGVSSWRGRGPSTAVYGSDAEGVLQVVLMPICRRLPAYLTWD